MCEQRARSCYLAVLRARVDSGTFPSPVEHATVTSLLLSPNSAACLHTDSCVVYMWHPLPCVAAELENLCSFYNPTEWLITAENYSCRSAVSRPFIRGSGNYHFSLK